MSTRIPAERSAAIERLLELVGIETPSLDLAASARIADALAERYSALGGAVELHRNETGTHLVADFPGHGEPLLLVGHSDTVWPVGAIEGAVPLRRTGTTIAGPGVYDMKSGLVVIEHALQQAAAEGPRRAVRVVVTADEEVGSPGSRELLTAAATGVVGAIGFESPHPDGALKVGRRGSTRLRIDVTGREAHAALDPGLGVSAVDELVDQLLRLRAFLEELSAAGREVLGNVGTVQGGTRANVIAGRAAAEIGLRFIDPETESQVLGRLAAPAPVRPGAVVETTVVSNRPAWLARDRDTAFAAALASAAGIPLPARPAAGAGDVNGIAALGVPCVDGFGPRGRGAHAPDEQVAVESLFERIETLTRILVAPTR